jgi:hypothetical protein
MATALLVAMAASSRHPAGDKTLVDATAARDVTYPAQPWTAGRDCMECWGGGNLIVSADTLGAGDFTIKARLALANLNASYAHFRLGANYFCFDSRDRQMHANGPQLGGNDMKMLGPWEKYISKDEPFLFEVRRRDKKFTFILQTKTVFEWEGGNGPIGTMAFDPGNNTLRLYQWTVSGNLEAPKNAGPKAQDLKQLQERVDAAIDRGIQFLLQWQHRDGMWGHEIEMYPPGQTALCAYTMLKCGLPPSHPALQRAFASLDTHIPEQTYTTSLMIMAYEATGDPRYKPRIQQLTDMLVGTSENGVWSYPWRPSFPWVHEKGLVDLSNSQFAVLGLRAAHKAGVHIDPRVWLQIIETTLKFQEPARLVDAKTSNRGPGTTTGKVPIAGFGYQNAFNPYGSMTAAGICILAIGRDMVGKGLSGQPLRTVNNAIDAGVNWLAENFSAGANPRKGDWLYYYLYGLERVGALLKTDQIGGHDWYYEGAKWILDHQGSKGEWTEYHTEADTCFALLFLRRATAPILSGNDTKMPKDLYISEAPTNDVNLRGSGSYRLRIWISGFGDAAKKAHGGGALGGMRVARVEYLVDGKQVAEVAGNPKKPWTNEKYLIEHEFKSTGKHRVSARVLLVASDAPAEETHPSMTIYASGFDVQVDSILDDWMIDAASARTRNLLTGQSVAVTSSSNANGNEVARKACDGYEATRWLCAASDTRPRLTLELQKSIKANTIVIGQAFNKPASGGMFDRITEVEIKLNNEKPFRAQLDVNDFKPSAIPLPKTAAISKIDLVVVSRVKNGSQPGVAGISEIALEMRK